MNELFKFHKLNEKGQKKAQKIAELFDNLSVELKDIWFDGRKDDTIIRNSEYDYRRIVLQNLEVACFYAKKLMAMQRENEEEKKGV